MNTNFGELKALIQVKSSQLYLRKVLMADIGQYPIELS